MTIGWRGQLAALLGGAVLAACTSVSTDPDTALSIQFDSLPAGAVVLGDTMRGADLLPARVPARAFSGSGSVLNDSLLRLIGIDSTSVRSFNVIAGTRLVGTALNSTVRVVAQSGTVQSQIQQFAVVSAPTLLARVAGDSVADSLVYTQPDTARRIRDVRVRVLRSDTAVVGLRVRFRVVSFPTSQLDSVRLLPTSGGRFATESALSAASTGDATVRVQAFPRASHTPTSGTITLEASLRALGRDVPGSPLRFTVRLVPFTLTP
jgi:hypothetical protein